MGKFRLAFGIHSHQPVGNFPAVFESAHASAYRPFADLLRRYPSVRVSLHQSGILWSWQEKAHPEYLQLVNKLIEGGQLELLTGGFYEPILISIPERDGRRQIAQLTAYLQRHFKCTPEGLWLTERIWEPHLPKLLAESGVRYVALDDTHFLYAGLEPKQLTGPFVTEHEGHQLVLLPIQKRLRYLIPFAGVDEVIAELKRQAERNPDGMAVYADDGEKFGVWPQTHKRCYTDGWLNRFFEAVTQNADWLEVVPLAEAATAAPVGRAYLPSAAYSEMLHWALPPESYLEYEELEAWLKEQQRWTQFGRYVRGGHWRGFLAKYDEANLMHKHMLRVSEKLSQLEAEKPELAGLANGVRDRLYAAQCNCPYWHGIFGGLYLPHIRQAIWSNLIEAAARLRELAGETELQVSHYDLDADGHPEVVVESDHFAATFKPSTGGMLVQLALCKHGFDPTDTLTRRREGYHLKLDRAVTTTAADKTQSIHDLILAKEPGLKDYLVQDWHPKRCFIDHFLPDDIDPARFAAARYQDEGDFTIEPYECSLAPEEGRVVLSRTGRLRRSGSVIPVRLRKEFSFQNDVDHFQVRYELSCPQGHTARVKFAIETNFNFQAGHAPDRFILIDDRRPGDSYLDSRGGHLQALSYGIVDQYRDIAIACSTDRPAEIWHLPIYTVSLSEGGFEKVYQGTTFVSCFPLDLSASPVTIKVRLRAGTAASVSESSSETPT